MNLLQSLALDDPTVQTVTAGTALIGAVGGFVGTFAVIRRRSLEGDAVSHAALPGVAIAFCLGSRLPIGLQIGGAIAGWFALMTVNGLSRRSVLPFDAVLGGVLAVFFGIGLATMRAIQQYVPGAANHGLERYLFGQAATMRMDDLHAIAGFGLIAVVTLLLLWKQVKLVSFDPAYATVQGIPTRFIDGVLAALVVGAVVVGLQAVGVVLMSALLVAPAVAARQWTNRLGPLSILAAGIGAIAGMAGTLLSTALSDETRSVSTGPTIVLCVTSIVVASILFSPRSGLLSQVFRRKVLPT